MSYFPYFVELEKFQKPENCSTQKANFNTENQP